MGPQNPDYLVRVETDFATFGFIVKKGVVVEAAPIAKWSIGRSGKSVVKYWRKRGGKVTWQPLLDD